ncbi:MAG: hypothetical protein WA691_07925 [Thermoplasmata archaeon]
MKDEILQFVVVRESNFEKDVRVPRDEKNVFDLGEPSDFARDRVRLRGLDLEGDQGDDVVVPPDLGEGALDGPADRRLG